MDVNDNVWTSGLHSGSNGQVHTLTLGQLNLSGDAQKSRFFGRGRGGAEAHNVQLR